MAFVVVLELSSDEIKWTMENEIIETLGPAATVIASMLAVFGGQWFANRKTKQDREAETKAFYREKLEQLVEAANRAATDSITLGYTSVYAFQQVFDGTNEIDPRNFKSAEGAPSSTVHMLINLYFPDLKQHLEKIEDCRSENTVLIMEISKKTSFDQKDKLRLMVVANEFSESYKNIFAAACTEIDKHLP